LIVNKRNIENKKVQNMLQRIQTLWLLLAAICAFLMVKLSFYSGNKIMEDGLKKYEALSGATSPIYVLILIVATGIGALIAIFLYKDRKTQKRLTIVSLLVSIINIVLLYLETKKFAEGEGNYDLSAVLSVAVPVFLILALRGIANDQKLIKSLDRLR
jgi:Ni/Fe-hydrogenase subunit HybB-like protein